jgi:hypothetical protein
MRARFGLVPTCPESRGRVGTLQTQYPQAGPSVPSCPDLKTGRPAHLDVRTQFISAMPILPSHLAERDSLDRFLEQFDSFARYIHPSTTEAMDAFPGKFFEMALACNAEPPSSISVRTR